MGISLVDILIEAARQKRTGDDRYYRTMPWVFRLVVDGSPFAGPTGPDGVALFPLPVGPDDFSYDLPFATTVTPTEEGGKVIERGGIITGNMRIGGSTGFKLRQQRTLTVAGGGGEFTSLLAEVGNTALEDVSGQMSFWILANRCFEGYSALLQDPQYASKTRLELHIMKERLHLEVEPKSFGLRRSSGRERVSYRYEINLEVIGAASELIVVEDSNIFDDIIDGVSKIRSTIQAVKATLDDINAARAELTHWVASIGSILDDAASVVQAGTNLVSGVKDTFDLPESFMSNLSGLIDSTADFLEETFTLYPEVSASFRDLGDQMDAIRVAAIGRYRDAWRNIADKYNELTEPTKTAGEVGSLIQAEIQDTYDESIAAGGTQSVEQVYGASVMPGDLGRQQLPKLGGRMNRNRYDGVQQVTVGDGDTLQSLAAKYMGDPQMWVDIAAANQLDPPYVTSSAKMPNTVQTGSTILIPISKRVPQNMVVAAPADIDAQMGCDALVVPIGKQWGWEVDLAHGGTDIKKVRGIPNMVQGLGKRLRTVRGENILQPTLGVRRSVGARQFGDQVAEAVMLVRQQVMADPRVQRLIAMDFDSNLDALELTMNIQPVGYSTARIVTVPLT